MVTLLPLGLTAPFGTTILGWIGVAQIRRSAGKLYGLGLAVFDGLFFPLLALDALIFFIGARGFVPVLRRMLAENGFRDTRLWDVSLALCATVLLLICAILDLLIIRRVWRAANSPLASSRPTAPPAAP